MPFNPNIFDFLVSIANFFRKFIGNQVLTSRKLHDFYQIKLQKKFRLQDDLIKMKNLTEKDFPENSFRLSIEKLISFF